MLTLKNITIALLFTAVFVNSKSVRKVKKKECYIGCVVYNGALNYICKNGELTDSYFTNIAIRKAIRKCKNIDYDMDDNHIAHRLELDRFEKMKRTLSSFIGDFKIEIPQSEQECLTFVKKLIKKQVQIAIEIHNVCKCQESKFDFNLDEECKKPDSPFQIWLNE